MRSSAGSAKADNRPTIAEWPVRIWEQEEIPPEYRECVKQWMRDTFASYDFVLSPKRRTAPDSFEYLFGYGKDEALYLRLREQGMQRVSFKREDVTSVQTSRELLNAEILVTYLEDGRERQCSFPYVPSTYYLYDPFLNWLLKLPKDFDLPLEERSHPRPDRLFQDSVPMYNYSLAAYRLGEGFEDYTYRFEVHRRKWMPWRTFRKEWLRVPMERGEFCLYSANYLTQCTYHIK